MTVAELREEISIELELMEETVRELSALQRDAGAREPTVREKTAAAGFMAQFYGGVENILKRISRFHGVQIPTGDTWHIDLFKRFSTPSQQPLPVLFDNSLATGMAAFRKFRHVVHHGYGFQLDWSRMQEGMASIENIFMKFKSTVNEYLRSMK
ncbi:MAG: hypothetical protein AABZ10_12340 [Nitrospirota bacterium]